jgi:hypothetical protein
VEQEQGLVVETGHEGTFSDGEAAGGGKKKKTKGEGPVVEKGPKKWPFEGRHAEAARRGTPGEKVRVRNPFKKDLQFRFWMCTCDISRLSWRSTRMRRLRVSLLVSHT